MKAEMIDVVNENGVRTGEIVSRAEIHRKGLWHRVAMLCIVNSNNEMLLQQRHKNLNKFPGLWDLSVASHVQSGSDVVSTLLKEVNEEIGIQIEYKVQAKDFRFITSFRNHHVYQDLIENQYYDLFVLRKDIDLKDITFNDKEVQDVQWVNYTKLQKLIKAGVMHPRLEWVDEIVNYINRL